jgi:hypothetical protein
MSKEDTGRLLAALQTFEHGKGVSAREAVHLVRDQSNAAGFNHSSTEVLVMVRRGF